MGLCTELGTELGAVLGAEPAGTGSGPAGMMTSASMCGAAMGGAAVGGAARMVARVALSGRGCAMRLSGCGACRKDGKGNKKKYKKRSLHHRESAENREHM
ncbi:MAG TPA: hypothetical protein VMV57_04860 [Terracidiphilus sp.]|nr:hypothetical protein [Terracidiphilus sp.]